MKIIAVVQRKGGAGKTTVAVNVAGEILRRGYTVSLIDADPQGSAHTWALPRRLGFPVRPAVLSGLRSVPWIKAVYTSGTDFVVVDTPPELADTFKLCVELADLLLIPCGPSSLDINATIQTVNRLREITRAARVDGPPALVVPTRIDEATPEGLQLGPELSDLGFSVTEGLVFDLSFVRAFSCGQTVATFAPASEADRRVRRLVEDVLSSLNMPGETNSGMH